MHVFPCPLVRRIYIGFYLVKYLDGCTLGLFFFALSLFLRKAYRRYIPASRDFIHLWPFAFLWISLNGITKNERPT